MGSDQRFDDLAVLYVGLAHGVDGRLHYQELTEIEGHLERWRQPGERRDVSAIVDEVVKTYGPERVIEAVQRLGRRLSEREQRAVLDDLSVIALADRRFLKEEAEYIGRVAFDWGLQMDETEEGALWTVLRSRGDGDPRSLAMDLALLYLVVAHRPDDDISHLELAAIHDAMAGWLPDLREEQVAALVRSALEAFSRGMAEGGAEMLLRRVRASIHVHQRGAVIRDIRAIAAADGDLTVEAGVLVRWLEDELGT